jgi:hypothetical protein
MEAQRIVRLEGDKPITISLVKRTQRAGVYGVAAYMLLVVAVLTFGAPSIKAKVNTWTTGSCRFCTRQPVTRPVNRRSIESSSAWTPQHDYAGCSVVPKNTPMRRSLS